ncbi:MAG: efflux RND transporter periplasmic adaptor subunit [Minisyncoccia bacterium]
MKKIFKNKKLLIIFVSFLAIMAFLFYKNYNNKSVSNRYILAQVKRDNLSVTVSQSGVIAPLDEIELKTKTSGEVVYLNLYNGQKVKKGDLLLKIDSSDQERKIKDLELDVESAQVALAKAKQTTIIDEKTLKNQAITSLTEILTNWKDFLNDFDEIFKVDISSYRVNADYLYQYYASIVNFYYPQDIDYKKTLEENYTLLKNDYYSKSSQILKLNSNSSLDEIESTLNLVLNDIKILDDTARFSYQLISRYSTVLSDYNLVPLVSIRNISTDKTTFNNLSSAINANLSTILSVSKNITSYKEGAQNNYPYDIKELEISLEKKKEDLKEAKDELKNYYLYAPFDGIISNINVKKGDTVSSQLTVAKLITHQKIAEVSFNEIDAVKIKIGQKAKLTFDALPNLIISGKVIEIDPIGTESQGVVSYNVKVELDEDNENIKPSMSVNIEIIVEEKENVLVVPNSAIKTIGERKYVEVVENINLDQKDLKSGITLKNQPARRFIKTGSSNDLMTEIIEGLKEGDYIILSTVSTSSNKNTTQSNSFMNQRTNFNPQFQFQPLR